MRYTCFVLSILLVLIMVGCTSLFEKPPTCLSVMISGIPVVGNTLQGEYELSDPDYSDYNKVQYAWYTSSSADSSLSRITGADSDHYKLVQEDEGQYIYFEVILAASKGKSQESCISDPVGPVEHPPAMIIKDAMLNTHSGDYDQDIVIMATNLGHITAFEIVLEYDPDHLQWDGFSAESKLGGLTISQRVQTETMHFAYIAVSSLDREIDSLTAIAAFSFKTAESVEVVKIGFSECTLSGGLQVRTTVRPKIEDLKLFEGNISIQ